MCDFEAFSCWVQCRLSETLQRVNLVINRTNAIDGIKHALAGEDFEGAARYVKSYYDLADSTAPEEAPVQTPQAEEQAKVIADDEVRSGACPDMNHSQGI